MSLKYAEFVAELPQLERDSMTTAEKVAACHEKVFWQEVVSEETGEVTIQSVDGKTKQKFRDETDVNRIVARHQISTANSHLITYPPEVYREFEGVDLMDMHLRAERAKEIFAALGSELRNEFNNNAFQFISFASDPANREKLAELLPELAEPGKQMPNPHKRGGQGAAAATAQEEPQDTPPAAQAASGPGGSASTGSEAAPASSPT